MSTAVSVVPLPDGAEWARLVAELGVGLLLFHENGAVWASAGVGERAEDWRLRDDRGAPLPNLDVLAAQARDADTAATIAVLATIGGMPARRLWVELYPTILRGERCVLAVLRPVQTDVWRGKGLLDPLTGLANRVLLFDRLDQALRRARVHGSVVTLVLADLRGLGALAAGDGDELLRKVAERLGNGLREDHTVARYAGGTFAVVGEQPQRAGGVLTARIVRLAGHPVRVGWVTSCGGDSVHDLIRQAHRNLA
ncbi:diguanylate cyclase domain-containing protein [Actinophytocola sp.]|uniref:diguanylate cyclase domain-containing protein n=1 Tax=Actinophytocola sp. TaxID=1872138 RepID=UPI002EDAF152